MTSPHRLPHAPSGPVDVPRPQPSANLLGSGLVLLIVGSILLSSGMDSALGVLGIMTLAAGGLSVASGVHRTARNVDTLAAAVYNDSLRREA